jgi:hypothetical protein
MMAARFILARALALFLFAAALGMPVVQLVHQASHDHHDAIVHVDADGGRLQVGAGDADGDDCRICQILALTHHVTLDADTPPALPERNSYAIVAALSARDFRPSPTFSRFARGPPSAT